MKLKEPTFSGFDSSAIKSISFNNNLCEIVFKSSDKCYNYTVNDNNFVKTVEKTIKDGESIGKLVNNAIKANKLEIIEYSTDKLNKTVV
tara:strand:- start:265 stop:531 length:267 start_codon:yes stop_codon:yes gene_type:complete